MSMKNKCNTSHAPGTPDKTILQGRASIERRFRIPRKSAELLWLAMLHCLLWPVRSHKTIHLHHPFAAGGVCWGGTGRSHRSRWNKIGRSYQRGPSFVLEVMTLDLLAIAARWYVGRVGGPPPEADRPRRRPRPTMIQGGQR